MGSPSIDVYRTYLVSLSQTSASTDGEGAEDIRRMDLQAMEKYKKCRRYAERTWVTIPGDSQGSFLP